MGYHGVLSVQKSWGIFEFLKGSEKSLEEVAAALKCSSSRDRYTSV
jgi:hypothetical protein